MAEKEPEKEGSEEGAAPKKKNKMMFIIIGAVAVALVGAGAFVVPKLLGGKDEKKTEAGKSEDGTMFALDPFVVNLNDQAGAKFLKISLQLELAGPAITEKAKQKTPQIRDAVITLLTSKSSEALFSPEGKLQLKDEITMRMNQILGQNSVKNVYLTDFVMQ